MIPFLGPLFGLLGSLVTSGTRIYEKKIDYSHELMLYKAQAELRVQEMESEERIAEASANAIMRRASYDHDTEYGRPSKVAADILRFVRPFLTFFLMCMVAVFWFTVPDLGIREKIMLGVMDYAGMAMSWWFGSRSLESVAKR